MYSYFVKLIEQFKIPPFLSFYFSGTEFPDELSQSTIIAFQDEAVREVINNAYQGSPFYLNKMNQAGVTPQDIKGVADLSKMPFLTKDELRGKPWQLLACDKNDISVIHVSTGTTGGEEIYNMYTWRDYFTHELVTGYPRLFPVEQSDICFNALPYEMSSAGLSFHKVFMHGCGATVINAGKAGAYSTPEKAVKLLRDLQPTVVITTPSYAISLMEAARDSSFDLTRLPIKKMWLTGEGCSPAFRSRVEKYWGTKAESYYGSLEGGVIAIECDTHTGYHVTQTHVFVEIVDPKTGRVMEPGEIGEIVVTCLLRFDTPLIRYRTQDLGYIDPEPCRCGLTMPRIFLQGRLVDEIMINGVNFSPFYLEEFLMRIPEVGDWYNFIVKDGDNQQLKLRVELAEGVKPTPELSDMLASKMEFAVGVPCQVEIVDRMPRPREKTVRVIHE